MTVSDSNGIQVLLFVEQNHKIARTLKNHLEQESFWVHQCHATADAYSWILHNRHRPPSAVIIDVPTERSTQSANAFQLYKLLKHGGWVPELEQRFEGWNDSVPILMLVDAASRLEVEERMYALDVQPERIDYNNPLRPHILVNKLRMLAQREIPVDNQIHDPDIIRIRSLRIDPDVESVSVGTQPIKLSQLEFELLHYLASHPNMPITRETLLEDIWGISGKQALNNRNVDVYIGRLRKKLKGTECADIIGRGHGGTYVLETNSLADDLTEPEGARLHRRVPEPAAPIGRLTRVTKEPRLPLEFPLQMGENRNGRGSDIKIGRNGNMTDCVITDKRISRWHATIFVHGDNYFLRDEDSTGGTYIVRSEEMPADSEDDSLSTVDLQRKQLEPRQHIQLNDGDHIYFNTIAYCFELQTA